MTQKKAIKNDRLEEYEFVVFVYQLNPCTSRETSLSRTSINPRLIV